MQTHLGIVHKKWYNLMGCIKARKVWDGDINHTITPQNQISKVK